MRRAAIARVANIPGQPERDTRSPARPADEAMERAAHGGDLDSARQQFPSAPEPWIDLSTGINPLPYPLPALPPEVWQRLPGRAETDRLAATAARAYGAGEAGMIVAAPGTQALIGLL